jgi:pimeloyl-ACP methyl ester carboxylesterase
MTDIREGSIQANGIEFATIEAGEGTPVLLLHGFPDNPYTYSAQLDALASNGYRAVAPYMRGYPPTGPAPDGRYDSVALAGDVAALAGAIGDGEPAYVVGNDWGAISTYGAMALHPETIRRAVIINVGHPATFLTTLAHPKQLHHIFHFWFFQRSELAAGAVRASDFALVDYLWDYWSAPGHDYADHLAQVKRTLEPEGALEAGIAYYAALVDVLSTHPEAAAKIQGRIATPTLTIFGDHDPPRELSEGEHVHFDADYRLEIVAGAGHFVHREQADQVNRLILDWFAGEDR